MTVGFLTAYKGRIFVTRELLDGSQGKTTKLEMALEDGAPDYNYCKGEVKIVAVIASESQVSVKGSILYGNTWRPFAGVYSDGEVSFDFLDL